MKKKKLLKKQTALLKSIDERLARAFPPPLTSEEQMQHAEWWGQLAQHIAGERKQEQEKQATVPQ